MRIATYLEVLASAQTVFDLRPLTGLGRPARTELWRSINPAAPAPPGLDRARDNLLSLCGRELGRFAADQAAAYAAFSLAMQGPRPVGGRTLRLSSTLEKRRVAYLRAIDGGNPDSLPAWRFLGLLYALDPGLDAAFEPEALPPYRCCRDLTALRLAPRRASGPVGPLHVLGLVAFAELFPVFHLDFPTFLRLLDRHGRSFRRRFPAGPPLGSPALAVHPRHGRSPVFN